MENREREEKKWGFPQLSSGAQTRSLLPKLSGWCPGPTAGLPTPGTRRGCWRESGVPAEAAHLNCGLCPQPACHHLLVRPHTAPCSRPGFVASQGETGRLRSSRPLGAGADIHARSDALAGSPWAQRRRLLPVSFFPPFCSFQIARGDEYPSVSLQKYNWWPLWHTTALCLRGGRDNHPISPGTVPAPFQNSSNKNRHFQTPRDRFLVQMQARTA